MYEKTVGIILNKLINYDREVENVDHFVLQNRYYVET